MAPMTALTAEKIQKAKQALQSMGDKSEVYWLHLTQDMAKRAAQRLRELHPEWRGSDRRILRKAFPDIRMVEHGGRR